MNGGRPLSNRCCRLTSRTNGWHAADCGASWQVEIAVSKLAKAPVTLPAPFSQQTLFCVAGIERRDHRTIHLPSMAAAPFEHLCKRHFDSAQILQP